ncbi:MAG: hypothetical protein Q8P52_03595 [bacterium]|nr:hypothetical protein [bacterium]
MFLLYAFKSCTDDTGYLAYPTEADMKNGQVFAILATFHRAEEGGPKKIGLLQKVSVKTDVSRQTFSYEILNESPRHYQLEWQKYDGVTNLVAIKKDGLVTLVPYPLKPELEPKEVSPKSMEEEDVEKE